ncbi:MAG: anti-sigma factor antagonist [Coriobacteriia bacterium]
MDLSIEYGADSRVCVVRMAGELDIATVPEVRETISSALSRGCVNVVLDLSRIRYADSSAFSLLVWLDRELQPSAGKLVLAGASGNVSRILELSGLIGAAPCIAAASDVTEAVSGLDLDTTPTQSLWSERMVLSASAASLADIRTRVVALLEPLDIPEADLFDIRVAVGEALANAIRHGSPGGPDDTVAIQVDAHVDRVVIVVNDSGCGFDGCTVRSEDLYASSGRGVMFMRALMDQVDFRTSADGGTSVTLVKHVSGQRRARKVSGGGSPEPS